MEVHVFFKYRLKQRDDTARKMIVTNLFLQQLEYSKEYLEFGSQSERAFNAILCFRIH